MYKFKIIGNWLEYVNVEDTLLEPNINLNIDYQKDLEVKELYCSVNLKNINSIQTQHQPLSMYSDKTYIYKVSLVINGIDHTLYYKDKVEYEIDLKLLKDIIYSINN